MFHQVSLILALATVALSQDYQDVQDGSYTDSYVVSPRNRQERVRTRLQQVSAVGQQQVQYEQRPYEYGYQLDDTNGSHGHKEVRDESGRVEGEYSINLGDGRVRVVKYVADENGYRADVSTDELGTESKNPNDVWIGSTAISGFDAALKYGPFAPPHVERPLEVAPRPEAPRRVEEVRNVNTQVRKSFYHFKNIT